MSPHGSGGSGDTAVRLLARKCDVCLSESVQRVPRRCPRRLRQGAGFDPRGRAVAGLLDARLHGARPVLQPEGGRFRLEAAMAYGGRARRWLATGAVGFGTWTAVAAFVSCRQSSARAEHPDRGSPPATPTGRAGVAPLSGSAGLQADADAGAFLDCVGVLQVQRVRGTLVANARRFGEANAAWRTASRLSDLAGHELRDFCDWEACIRTNGYRHACYLNDAGWERCRVCDAGGDCDGLPMSQDDCVAHATDVGRATCHVGSWRSACCSKRCVALQTRE